MVSEKGARLHTEAESSDAPERGGVAPRILPRRFSQDISRHLSRVQRRWTSVERQQGIC